MHERIKQRHLHCFQEIVRQGSLVKAATELAITQSATSKTLSELEEIVGERLLDRNRGGIALTPAGEIFHRYTSASLTAVRQGLELIAQQRQDARRAVLVGALPNAAADILPPAIVGFKADHPEVPIVVRTGTNRQLLQALRVAEVDFVVGRLAQPGEMMGLQFEHLYFEKLCWVARNDHPLFSETDFHPKQMVGYTQILPPSDTVIRPEIDSFLISRGFSNLKDTIETLSPEVGRHCTAISDALWIVPYGVIKQDLASGALRELPVDLSSTRGPVGISTRTEAGLTILSRDLLERTRAIAQTVYHDQLD
ncbi:pca operon transcription factor PcaQ [Saccharospirillum impatiens]|uniref:pca operon transcription factor PcaQ n=1 Tax=Saccharospirillum impatiens TaxID=169438 RepID=UPI0004013365|nr:pca operon transcription factor PcaQ [Saccharospirillum impatiens]